MIALLALLVFDEAVDIDELVELVDVGRDGKFRFVVGIAKTTCRCC